MLPIESCIWMLEEASKRGSPIRQLTWQSDYPWNDEQLFEKTSKFPLSSLDLSGLRFRVPLEAIFTRFDRPTLKHFHFGRLTWSKHMTSVMREIDGYCDWSSVEDGTFIEE